MTTPNIVFVMSDDHAAHAISAYGGTLNHTPELDRIAEEGARFDSCFCTNAICAPSRAVILTGTHSHVNGVMSMAGPFDAAQPTFPALLQEAGYQTALFGKWHLGHGAGHDPQGFDEWRVLRGQGEYHDPVLSTAGGDERHEGYVTDVLTELSLDWLRATDRSRPFCLLLHHKAPHRGWEPAERHRDFYNDRTFEEPATFRDDYATRTGAAQAARMRVGRDLTPKDLKMEPPPGLDEEGLAAWRYQRFITDYLRCVAAVDESVGRLLGYLDEAGLTRDTVFVYTSDQGFFLGDHGWYDKRFIYEHALRMPLLVRYPREVEAGSVRGELVSNVDFAQTLLDWAGIAAPARMQGVSLRPLVAGWATTPPRDAVYYRYWQHQDPAHGVWAHYGIRTDRYKLIYFYNDGLGLPGTGTTSEPPCWELYDLATDPDELSNVWNDPAYARIRADLTEELARQQAAVDDRPHRSQAVTA
ncbi:sulfatase family protein [Nonomuraea diastatica]|uniref:DUF4976 domain-containing protein n=1 Tax=Nonomuraea diastatica TaxID=1848329 RepID=A0A4R4WV23_9ACTN|nr:sulfatase [Nonomuraea diastatica]TDD21504.1 DUF4976 domain-containing protein [Nonomuraea diastatica]